MDFSYVTALQIPEGNVTKIEDKEGKILWANINKLAYGVRWDSVNQATTACERIGNLELHKTLPIQSRFKVCIHKGKEIQYYCNPNDSRFRENPTILSKNDFIFDKCDGLPSGIVCCDENSDVDYKILNDIFADYKYLYAYIYIKSNGDTCLARIVYVDIINKTAYINTNVSSKSTYAETTIPLDYIVSTDANYNVELGTVLNGYDGEIGVDTGGKFYQWSVDKDGAGNEVWQSLYKCVPYAREIKRHIIGIDRACVLNVAFNDTKWGWIGSLEANTAVDVINYHTNLRGGANSDSWDEYLGIDNFRCQLGKARTNLTIAEMRSYSQKTDGGQMLYKQIWEAIVWSYVIEYADFDVKKAYNDNLTTEGYHQGGLGNGVVGGNNLINYNGNQKLVPNDYTLELGNNTIIKRRAAIQNQIAYYVPHWRGFNVFWYGDIYINVDNMLSKYDTTKQKRIWYYTDDVSKFNDNITNKEHQIEGFEAATESWLREVRINNKGDIVPSKIGNYSTYKNSYYWNNVNNNVNIAISGGAANNNEKCNILSLSTYYNINYGEYRFGFVKVTILDD